MNESSQTVSRPVVMIVITIMAIVAGSFVIFTHIADEFVHETGQEHILFLQRQTLLLQNVLEPIQHEVSAGHFTREQLHARLNSSLEHLNADSLRATTGTFFWVDVPQRTIHVPVADASAPDVRAFEASRQRVMDRIGAMHSFSAGKAPFPLLPDRQFSDDEIAGYVVPLSETGIAVGTFFRAGSAFGAHMHNVMRARIWGIVFVMCLVIPVAFALRGIYVRDKQLLRDIQERKEAQDALRESEERFKTFMAFFPGCTFIKDSEGRFVYMNDTYQKTFGVTAADSYGKTVADIFPSHVVKRIVAEDVLVLQGQAVHGDHDMRPVADGVLRHFYTSRFPVMMADKRIFIGGVHIDITEQKRVEEQARQLEERLQRAEKMEALGTLAGGVAHDLNNILSGIVSYPDMLLYQLPPESPIRSALMTIKQSGERAAAVVQDLLTMARRGIQSDAVVDLNDIVSSYVASPEYTHMFGEHRGVDFSMSLDPDLLPMVGSAIHLNKLVMNLVTNAVEAIESEGSVMLTTKNVYLDHTLPGYEEARPGEYLVLEITDTGKGISSADIEKIFEPFYTRKILGRSGTGLGLAVVWGIIKDHDGYIDVRSTPGAGATFTVFFPATRMSLPAEEQRVDLAQFHGRGESVLIVDDLREQREIAASILTSLGYSVTSVDSGLAAIEWLKIHQVDLVLLDMIMEPGLSGLETYQRMLAIRPGQRAIVVSGYAETDDVKEALALGAGMCVKKPYLLDRLALAVRQELDRT